MATESVEGSKTELRQPRNVGPELRDWRGGISHTLYLTRTFISLRNSPQPSLDCA